MDTTLLALLLRPIAFPEPEEITRRSDLERWSKRAKRRKKILLVAYLVGLLGYVIMATIFASKQGNASAILAADITYAILVGLICSGPIVLLLSWMVLSSGISQYQRLVDRLRSSHRVCNLCDAIALYEDRYFLPSKEHKHSRADLVPHMNVIKEDGNVSMLCDGCLAEVNAMDASESV